MSLIRRTAALTRGRTRTTRPDETSALRGEIERYGWALRYVEATDHGPSVAYTVGLGLRGLPELAVRGLAPEPSWTLLNDAAGRATAGAIPVPGAVLTGVVAGVALHVRPMDDTTALAVAHEVCASRGRVRAVELVAVPEPVRAGSA
ncbi:DUF4262 domain-containing protein [Actinotalea ferrariae]|uniref:DUF4262 domain-containing protein n=1 Tax=Actinotalea ferrariae TaxID=1386098 RepID=UPI001C8C027B|nr:DUF4262 domain-containing protein [Actinotalea ferrariae]MBX9245317.1 DUF4262 domain-containing protein [Actinotalea ferrariae]